MQTLPTERGPFRPEDILGATPEDKVRRELIDGWLYIDGQPVNDPMAEVASDSATPRHQKVVTRLTRLISEYEDDHVGQAFVSPMDCLIDGNILQPDVLYLDHDDPVGHPIETTPALVIEVSSPSTRSHDLVRKRHAYERAGVREYWFVDLDAMRLERYHLADDGTYPTPDLVAHGALASTSLPDLAIDVEEVLSQGVY